MGIAAVITLIRTAKEFCIDYLLCVTKFLDEVLSVLNC